MNKRQWTLRQATHEDAPQLMPLIERSVLTLQAQDYSQSQLEAALGTVYGVDMALIVDGTYYVVVTEDGKIVGCGGWSRRATLFGVHKLVRDDSALKPGVDPARIRAFFIDPDWARCGIASAILGACEAAALAEGFTTLSLAATLTGLAFYRRKGFQDLRNFDTPLPNGEGMALVAMEKSLRPF
ncbi:MAG TPA: GNAT family N-acetyltransferase [Magnetospirillaceae bacterium]|nr:GNAT family N-acetyltransferase [Magnetospirillaceae bacterium]